MMNMAVRFNAPRSNSLRATKKGSAPCFLFYLRTVFLLAIIGRRFNTLLPFFLHIARPRFTRSCSVLFACLDGAHSTATGLLLACFRLLCSLVPRSICFELSCDSRIDRVLGIRLLCSFSWLPASLLCTAAPTAF